MKYSSNRAINAGCDRLVRSGEWVLKSSNRHVRLRNTRSGHVLNWLSQIRRDYGVSV